MAVSSANAAAAAKTRKVESLYSGTSWTVPSGVEYVNAKLIGGGGGGGNADSYGPGFGGTGGGGEVVETTVTTTPGASITYAIGAGGSTGGSTSGGTGGTTTFTGATSALGGPGGLKLVNQTVVGKAGVLSLASNGGYGANGGGVNTVGGAGAAGWIVLEYWV